MCRRVPLALPLTTSGRYRARCRLGCLPPLKHRPAIRVTKRPIDDSVQLVVVNGLRSRPRKLAFFVGGGKMVDTCFKAMEQVAVGKMTEYSRYGSNQQKRMFIYGRLDFGPTTLTPSYGFGWTLSGWLLTPLAAGASAHVCLQGTAA